MSRPIDRQLLIHTVIYEEKTGTGDFNEVTYKQPRKIEFTRLDHQNGLLSTARGQQEELKAILFHDEFNSTPCDFVPGSRITWGNYVYNVAGVNLLFDENKLHHKEVRLA